jgi:hypothetical protein
MHRTPRPLPTLLLAVALTLAGTARGQAADGAAQPAAAPAQSVVQLSTVDPPPAVTGADTIELRYDDGEPDAYYVPPSGSEADLAMRFDLPQANMQAQQATFCIRRTGSDPTFPFRLTFWAADGPGGAPGTLFASVNPTAMNVPSGANVFVTVTLSPGITIPDATAYLGVGWDDATTPGYEACLDNDGATVQPGYVDLDQQGDWTDLRTYDSGYTALILRGVFSDQGEGGPCMANETTLCLHNGRFKVQVYWTTQFGTSGPGHVVPVGTSDSGLFWFFNGSNWEMLLKVLDGCAVNDHYWVFFAATTNVGFTLTVTDTEAPAQKVYVNELGHRADAVTDTAAFATCP